MEVIFRIKSNVDIDIIDSELNIFASLQINKLLGRGGIGSVYKLKNRIDVIKISNSGCGQELLDEAIKHKDLFSREKIDHPCFPLIYGRIENSESCAIIFNYFGEINGKNLLKQEFNVNIRIINKLVGQLNLFENRIIHGDLKSANIVFDVYNNPTIIDFGLINDNDVENLITTNYITTPESLLTNDYYELCRYKDIDIMKHDYIGLFTIIVSLFVKSSYWNLITRYAIEKLYYSLDYLQKHKACILFVYILFRFNHKTKIEIDDISYFYLIDKIEFDYPNLVNKNYLSFDEFYDNYIEPDLYSYCIDFSFRDKLKLILKNLIKFNPADRKIMKNLLNI